MIYMTTDYHKKIADSLIMLGHEWKNQNKIKEIYRGSERPISLVDPRSKRVLNYIPDAYFILRNNKKLIFEVLDSERKKQDIIVADVIRSFLAENVDGLIFIHPGPESVENTIFEALKTIYKGLIDKGVLPSQLPSDKKTGPYLVTRKEAKNVQEIKDKLTQYANENKWKRL